MCESILGQANGALYFCPNSIPCPSGVPVMADLGNEELGLLEEELNGGRMLELAHGLGEESRSTSSSNTEQIDTGREADLTAWKSLRVTLGEVSFLGKS